jgi:hypothetical protein
LRPDKRKLSVAAGITRAPNQKKELFLFQLKDIKSLKSK